MQSFHASPKSHLEPSWLAVVAGISSLYGLWPVNYLYDDLIGRPGGGGLGWFVLALLVPFSFGIVLLIVEKLLVHLFCWLENTAARIAVCLILTLIFWMKNGVPHPLGLGLMACVTVFSFFHAGKLHEDARDREEFFNE